MTTEDDDGAVDRLVANILDENGAVEGSRLLGRQCAAFYTALVEGGVDEGSALALTETWLTDRDDEVPDDD